MDVSARPTCSTSSKKPEYFFGEIPGVPVGSLFDSRSILRIKKVHGAHQSGMHYTNRGVYAIVMNGGYADDVDFGESIVYSGHGGRDDKGKGAQIRDQTLTRGNSAMDMNIGDPGKPVRVVRGYKLSSPYAPEPGWYRYDGLYSVERRRTIESVQEGSSVYLYILKRLPNQPPPPWYPNSGYSARPIAPPIFTTGVNVDRGSVNEENTVEM